MNNMTSPRVTRNEAHVSVHTHTHATTAELSARCLILALIRDIAGLLVELGSVSIVLLGLLSGLLLQNV